MNFTNSIRHKRFERTTFIPGPVAYVLGITPNMCLSTRICKLCPTNLLSRRPVNAPFNSNLGTLITLRGATRKFGYYEGNRNFISDVLLSRI